jgi:transketolase
VAIENRHRPTALALTRQNVPTLDRSRFAPADGLRRGAYVLNPDLDRPDVLLMATGSELGLIVEAEALLARQGVRARLVSMPCWELFDEQDGGYRDQVLPPSLPARLAVEAGVSLGWHRWIGARGALLTLDRFGASAPASRVIKELGFTTEHVAERAKQLVG